MIHNIRYRVFIYENEDKDEILEALLNILPTAEPEVEEAEGLLEEKMFILTGIPTVQSLFLYRMPSSFF